jgi:hypothetical protein
VVRLTDLIRGAQDSPDDEGGEKRSSEGQAANGLRPEPIQLRNLSVGQPGASEPAAPQQDWYGTAETALQTIAAAIRQRQPVTLGDLPVIATAFVTSLARDDRLFVRAVSLRTEASLIRNLVNTAIFAVKVGMGLGYRRDELSRLGLAGLVHDLGMFRLPDQLLNDPGRWADHQIELLRTHPNIGAELLTQVAPDQPWLAEVALQEHERANGTGYPRGLKGYQTHEFAQIIGLADVFDALLTPRPYRRKMFPHEAIRELLMVEKAAFSSQVIKAMVEQFSVFPLGTIVRLNTGEVGVVAHLNQRFPLRPVVRINQGADRGSPAEPKDVDLSKTTLVHIVEVVAPEGTPGET